MDRQHRFRTAAIAAALALASACAESPTTPPIPGAGPLPRADEALVTPAGSIRVGVVPSDTGIDIGGTGAFTVRDKATGATLATGTNAQIHVSLVPGDATTYYRLQIICTSNLKVRDDTAAVAVAKGYETFTQWNAVAGCWRVLLGKFGLVGTYTIRMQYQSKAKADHVAGSDSWWPQITTGSSSQLKVISGGTVLQNANPVAITPTDGVLLIAGVRYRGTGEVGFNQATKLAGINELPLEQYLYGVVPKELSPGQYPEIEAIKAQAIAARTYALSRMGGHAADGYDVTATTSDQVYGGLGAEQAMSNQAVDETAGLVMTYGDRLISALYHSTSGGWTANNEEAYAADPVAYLRGIPDAERGEALEHVPSIDVFRNHANPNSLRAVHADDFESGWAHFHRWSYQWSAGELRDELTAYFGQDVGTVHEVNVVSRGPSGRIQEIDFVTDAGTFIEHKDRIRGVLKFSDAEHALMNLPSTLFFIEPVLDHRTGEVTGFQAWGGGFGHGVGMAQTGAVGMAQKGATYGEILGHYYQGITLEQR